MITSRALTTRNGALGLVALLLASLSVSGCTGKQDEPRPTGPAPGTAPSAAEQAAPAPQGPTPAAAGLAEEEPLPPPAYESGLPDAVREQLGRRFTGELGEMG